MWRSCGRSYDMRTCSAFIKCDRCMLACLFSQLCRRRLRWLDRKALSLLLAGVSLFSEPPPLISNSKCGTELPCLSWRCPVYVTSVSHGRQHLASCRMKRQLLNCSTHLSRTGASAVQGRRW